MTKLAEAYPSREYQYFNCLQDISLTAEYVNGKVIFYENSPHGSRVIKQDKVKELFPGASKRRMYRPFLIKENRKFYAVLYRNRVEYKEQFEQLKNQQHGTTEHDHPKRRRRPQSTGDNPQRRVGRRARGNHMP